MPGFLVNAGTTVLCAHGGKVQAPPAPPRVKVMGQPVATQGAPYMVSACGQPLPAPKCAVAQWVSGAVRVKVMGQAVLLADSKAIATPTGAPESVIPAQTRVKGM